MIRTKQDDQEAIRPGLASKSSKAISQEDVSCAFCGVLNPSYVCPKCELPYCSVSCYKSSKHVQCVDVFKSENGQRASKEEQRRIKQLLSQYNPVTSEDQVDKEWRYVLPPGVKMEDAKGETEESDNDESNGNDGYLERVVENASDEELWNMLTEEEKKGFLEFAKANTT
uniref:ARAD1D29810p n=1 Tax=Blastobotrys adeninivorans TaxID=409370 RepID=A0A060TBS8_BLAAD